MDTTSLFTVVDLRSAKRYWIVVASCDHVQRAVEGGFVQANHGKSAALQRMRKGDWIITYSSKEIYGKEPPSASDLLTLVKLRMKCFIR